MTEAHEEWQECFRILKWWLLTQFQKVKEAVSYKYTNMILKQCHKAVSVVSDVIWL
jgi:hypothetical protein